MDAVARPSPRVSCSPLPSHAATAGLRARYGAATEKTPVGRFAVGIAIASGLGLYLRLFGIDPPSLWLDDQWVGIVVGRMSWGQVLELHPAVPIGFVAVLKGISALVPDPEVSLQLFPLACSVAAIPALSLLVARATGRRSLGLLAGTLLALCPGLIVFGVAVKQYASDCLATIVVLRIGLPLLEQPSPRRAIATAGASALLLPFSFTSVFVAFPLLHLAVGLDRRPLHSRAGSAAAALGYDLALTAFYLALLRNQASDAMRQYFSPYFLPVDSVRAALGYLDERYASFLAQALPDASLAWMVAGIVPALIVLIGTRSTRSFGLFALFFYVQMLVVSALELYPLGTGRTDLFAVPLTLLVLCLGLHRVLRWPKADTAVAAGALALAIGAATAYARPAAYGSSGGYGEAPCRDAELVASLVQELREDDALLVYPLGSFSLGYYGPWPVELRPFADYAHNFEVRTIRPRTLTLPGYGDLARRPERLAPLLDRFLAEEAPSRLVYYASYAVGPVHPWLHRALLLRGFRVERRVRAPLAVLMVYAGPSSPEAARRTIRSTRSSSSGGLPSE